MKYQNWSVISGSCLHLWIRPCLKSPFYFCNYSDQFYYDVLLHLRVDFIQFLAVRMKSFASKFFFLFMTLVFPLSTIKCCMALIFIFSEEKEILFIHFLCNSSCQHLACFLSHFALLLGSALCHFLAALQLRSLLHFLLNSLSLFLIFYFFFNSSQSKTLAPSLTTSEQMFALEFCFWFITSPYGRRKSENSWWL